MADRPVQTIQQTGKIWKLIQALGVVMTLIGTVSCMATINSSPEAGGPFGGGGLMMLGLLGYIVGRVGAWWQHG